LILIQRKPLFFPPVPFSFLPPFFPLRPSCIFLQLMLDHLAFLCSGSYIFCLTSARQPYIFLLDHLAFLV
jgi:hypothetical protein